MAQCLLDGAASLKRAGVDAAGVSPVMSYSELEAAQLLDVRDPTCSGTETVVGSSLFISGSKVRVLDGPPILSGTPKMMGVPDLLSVLIAVLLRASGHLRCWHESRRAQWPCDGRLASQRHLVPSSGFARRCER